MHQSSSASAAYRNHREPSSYEVADFGGNHNDLDDTDGDFYVVRKPHKRPVYSGEDDSSSSRPVYVVHKPHKPQPTPKPKNHKKKIVVEVQDYNEDFEADTAPAATAYRQRAPPSAVVHPQYVARQPHEDDARHSPHHNTRHYADDNDSLGSVEAADFDVIVQEERYNHQQKHQRQQRRPPSPPSYYDRRPSTVRPYRSSSRPSSSDHYGSSRHRHRAPAGGQQHQHRHRYDDEDQHRHAYHSQMRKKYIWDRQTDFGADATRNNRPHQQFQAGGETSGEESSVEQPDVAGDGWRATGHDFGGSRDAFNRDLNDRLDRNYHRVFGSSQNAQTSTHHQSSTDHQVAGGGDEDQYSDADGDGGEETDDGTADHAERRQFSGSNIFQRRWDGGGAPGAGAAPIAAGRSMQSDAFAGDLGQQMQPLNFQAIPTGTSRNVSGMTGPGSRQTAAMQEKAVFDVPSSGVRRVYGKWSKWSKCSAKCTTKRWRLV